MRDGLLTLFGLVGALAVLAAVLVVWLVMQEPVMVADAVSTGQYSPLLEALTRQVGQWCQVVAGLL
jgi:hypothetical protein